MGGLEADAQALSADANHSPIFFVSPQGNDYWSGRLSAPAADGLDGPFATLGRAQAVIRTLKRQGSLNQPLTVHIRGGRYRLQAPLVFTPEDSIGGPVTYAAYPGEVPILDGGRRIAHWRIADLGEVRGGPATSRPVWVADLPSDLHHGFAYFRQLFVDGQRRHRARLPKVQIVEARNDAPDNPVLPDLEAQFYRMASAPDIGFDAKIYDGSYRFVAKPGDMRPWKYLNEVEVVALHYWVEERMPIAAFDPETGMVTSSRCSIFSLKDDYANRWPRYYIDNVFEGLSEPGEWYLERLDESAAECRLRLYYIPLPGETPENTDVFAPQLEQFLLLQGDPDHSRFIEGIHFDGLIFEHADWHQPDGGDPTGESRQDVSLFAASAQGAYHAPGAIQLEGARDCSIEHCEIRHLGFYGIYVSDGCRDVRIVGNHLHDLGAGGVHVSGADAIGPRVRRTSHIHITDNEIHRGGRVFHSGVGIFARDASDLRIAHNHIHDLFYSGISCGWVWGFGECVSRNNCIEKNHIHDLGHGWLGDMGGVYLLGVQPETVIRNNHIHHLQKANYGGWALYTDEGSSCMVLENNVCHDTNSQIMHQHFGHENIVRNNIFAFGAEAGLILSRVDDRLGLTFERNIVVTDDAALIAGGYGNDFGATSPTPGTRLGMISDLNLFWSATGHPVGMCGRQPGGVHVAPTLSLQAWQALGLDRHSLVADPAFQSLANRDFRLRPESPALALGFHPIDLSDVGPR